MNTVAINIGDPMETQRIFMAGLNGYVRRHDLQWDIRLLRSGQQIRLPEGAAVLFAHSRHVADATWAHRGCSPIGTLFGEHTPASRLCTIFDEQRFGAIAARHLYEKGYRRAALIETGALTAVESHRLRAAGFRSSCADLGMEVISYSHVPDEGEADLVAWLQASSVPMGIYTTNDGQGAWLLHILREAGEHLPAHVAILGTGNHLGTCATCQPELSSVSYPWRLMGEAAGRWVHTLLHGAVVAEPMLLRPYEVADRDTTLPVKVCDSLVRAALRWFRKNPATQSPLQDVASVLGCSQATLCRRFKRAMGASPQKVHNTMRLDRAVELLASKRLSIAAVAERAGFRSNTAFGIAFKRRFDCSPSEWRHMTGCD